jgi:hypothetical protein
MDFEKFIESLYKTAIEEGLDEDVTDEILLFACKERHQELLKKFLKDRIGALSFIQVAEVQKMLQAKKKVLVVDDGLGRQVSKGTVSSEVKDRTPEGKHISTSQVKSPSAKAGSPRQNTGRRS